MMVTKSLCIGLGGLFKCDVLHADPFLFNKKSNVLRSLLLIFSLIHLPLTEVILFNLIYCIHFQF